MEAYRWGDPGSFNPENGVVLARLGGTDGPGPFSQARFTELVMASVCWMKETDAQIPMPSRTDI